jgi:hypothetical protein
MNGTGIIYFFPFACAEENYLELHVFSRIMYFEGNVNTVYSCAKWDKLFKFLHLPLSRM